MANRRASLIVAAAALGLVVVGLTAAGVAPPTTVRIPMSEPGPEGKHLTLEATLYRPAGDGRRPALLFNHGATGRGAVAATTTMRPSILAPFFVARGFAVLAPMRRGRGASQGVHAEQEGACQAALLDPGFARALEDVDAAVAYVRAQPWADPDRLLVGGQARGGILSVVYASKRPRVDPGRDQLRRRVDERRLRPVRAQLQRGGVRRRRPPGTRADAVALRRQRSVLLGRIDPALSPGVHPGRRGGDVPP